MQVLALGLPRTGTDSLRTALEILGFSNVYHGFDHVDHPSECVAWLHLWHLKQTHQPMSAADFDRVLGDSNAVTDMPCAIFAPELLKAYPDALVIINSRNDIDAWYHSVCSVWDEAEKLTPWFYPLMKLFVARMFWLAEHESRITHGGLFKGGYGAYRTTGKEVYRDHYAMLDVISPKGEGRTLRWMVQDGWQPLCDFLGKEIPVGVAFPSRNAKQEVLEYVMKSAFVDGQTAFLRMVAFILFLIISIVILWVGRA